MTDINEMERRIYKMQRKQGKKNTDETLLGTNFHIIESEYYDIYYDYLSNLLLFQLTPPIQRATLYSSSVKRLSSFQLTPPIQRAT